MFKVWLRGGGLVALFAAAATAVLALSEQEWPDQGFWERNDWVVVASIVSVAVTSIMEGVQGARETRARTRQRQAEKLGEILSAALIEIADEVAAKVKWYDIGVHVWEVDGPWFDRLLVKRATLRIKDNKRVAGIKWRKGVGVIGRCWATQAPAGCDFADLASRYLKTNDVDGWNALTEEQRWGLSWPDLLRANSYGGVLAVPMYTGGTKPKFKGCVSLDGPPGSFTVLKHHRVRELLREVAGACASVLYYAPNQSH